MRNEANSDFSTELNNLIADFKITSVQKNEYILLEGEYCPGIPLVIKGSVKIIKEDDSGKEIVLYRLKKNEGCIMSITSAMLEQPTEASAVSETDVEMYLIPLSTSQEWLSTFPEWLNFILKTTNKRYFDLVRLSNDLSFKSISERLLNVLFELGQTSEEVNVNHSILANELGTAREVVSRLLKAFERQNLVKLSRGKIILLEAFYKKLDNKGSN